jgi:Cu2+-containing amine oxidase
MVYNLWYTPTAGSDYDCADCNQITMEDLQIVETVVRKDPRVIEQCGIIGISPEHMHKVYCDRR